MCRSLPVLIDVVQTYRPELDRRIAKREAEEQGRQAAHLDNLRKDAEDGDGGSVVLEASNSNDLENEEQ